LQFPKQAFTVEPIQPMIRTFTLNSFVSRTMSCMGRTLIHFTGEA